MDIRFDGKRALVTGGGRGIGEAIALKLVELGAQVLVVDVIEENLEKLKTKSPTIETRVLDVSDWEATRKCVQELCPIDLLVNNAGITMHKSILEATQEDIDRVFGTNFTGMYNIAQIVANDMISRNVGGAIVNHASVCGLRACPKYSLYCASKAAIQMLTKSLAVELARHKIRANCVAPTTTLTDMGKEGLANFGGQIEYVLMTIPDGKFPEIDDTVNAVMFLLSDKSSMINGATLPVDGAQLAHL